MMMMMMMMIVIIQPTPIIVDTLKTCSDNVLNPLSTKDVLHVLCEVTATKNDTVVSPQTKEITNSPQCLSCHEQINSSH